MLSQALLEDTEHIIADENLPRGGLPPSAVRKTCANGLICSAHNPALSADNTAQGIDMCIFF